MTLYIRKIFLSNNMLAFSNTLTLLVSRILNDYMLCTIFVKTNSFGRLVSLKLVKLEIFSNSAFHGKLVFGGPTLILYTEAFVADTTSIFPVFPALRSHYSST